MGAEVVPGEAAELQLAFEAAADRVTTRGRANSTHAGSVTQINVQVNIYHTVTPH